MSTSKIALEKLENIILYFAENCNNLGKVKLAKMLYFMDFDHFAKYEESITHADYYKWDMGPVIKNYIKLLQNLQKKGSIKIEKTHIGKAKPMEIIHAIKKSDMSIFSKEEKETIQEIMKKWHNKQAEELIKASHKDYPWIATKKNERIFYPLAFYRD